MQQMNRWRTQWENEMAEKNAVAAELLTLRSEFEKSSGTYDKEIEGLKDMLERTRAASAEMRDRWEESVTRKNALLGQLEEANKEMQRTMMSARGEKRTFAGNAKRLEEAKASLEEMKRKAEEAEKAKAAAQSALATVKDDSAAAGVKLNQDAEALRGELTTTKSAIEVGQQRQKQLDEALPSSRASSRRRRPSRATRSSRRRRSRPTSRSCSSRLRSRGRRHRRSSRRRRCCVRARRARTSSPASRQRWS